MASKRGRGVLTKAGVPRKSNTGTRKPVVDDSNWREKARGKHRIKFDDVAKKRYLDALRETGRKWFAEQAAGVARSTVDAHLKNDPEFADAYEDAAQAYVAPRIVQIEKELCEGHLQVTYDGKTGALTSEKRVFETRLREKFLEKHDPGYRQKAEVEHTGEIGLAVIPGVLALSDWEKAAAEHDRKNAQYQDPDAAAAHVEH